MSDLEERFATALHNSARAWRQAVDRRLKCLGCSQASWTTIAFAAKARSPLSQSELADRLGVEGATMVAMVDRLVKAGLVAREPSSTDRRIKHVVLTDAGNQLYDTVKAEACILAQGIAGEPRPEEARGGHRAARSCSTAFSTTPHDAAAAQPPHDHAVHHGGDRHANARCHHRERCPSAHAREPVGFPRPDCVGTHLVHRRRRDRDALDRLVGRSLRAKSGVSQPP